MDLSCRKLRNEEIHDLYSSPNCIRMTRLAAFVAHMTEEGFWWENLKGRATWKSYA
jgi:hypothetical protein